MNSDQRDARIMIESVNDAFVSIDANGLITEWNPQAEATFGWSREEAIGLRIDDTIIPAQHTESYRKGLARFLAGGEGPVLNHRRELAARHRDGHEFPVQLLVVPVRRDDSFYFHAFLHDITQRKQLEERLRLQSSALEAAANSITITDREGRITWVNSAFTQLTGYSAEQTIGHTHALLKSGQHDQTFYAQLWKTILAGQVWHGEIINRRQDGGLYTEEMTITPVCDETGTIANFIAVKQDVTDRKQAQEALSDLAVQLRATVDDLNRSNAELERSNLELQHFAYSASHDLQEPLRSVAGFCQLLKRRYQGRLDDQADQWIEYAVQSAARMRALIEDLLIYSRVESQVLPFEVIDCADVFDDAVAILKGSIEDSGACLTRNELPQVMGIRSQLVHVMQNLIGNGIKFRGEAPPQVHVSAARKGDQWVLSVCDNGIGVPAAQADSIFGLFRRLHTDHSYPGTGVGLAICRRVVERHQGAIWVESDAATGSTFYFTLPAATDGTESS